MMTVWARAKLEVEVVTSGGGWADKATCEQVRVTAVSECTNFLSNLLLKNGDGRCKIVGKPKVTLVLATPDEK